MKKLQIPIILLAAGASSRMKGVDKLLETIDNIPLLRRSAMACCDSPATSVSVILRARDPKRQKALLGLPVAILDNPRAHEGMASSLKLGLSHLPASSDGVLIVLADMPDVTALDLGRIIAGFQPETGKTICRASTRDGGPGHPVLFGRAHFAELGKLTGDTGGRAVLRANPGAVRLIETSGQGAQTDLDTPADWAAYRKDS